MANPFTMNTMYNDLPPELLAEQQAIERNRKFAEQLQAQAGNMPQGQMVSGIYVKPSITQYMAQALKGYQSKQMGEEANKRSAGVSEGYSKRMSEALSKSAGAMAGRPEEVLPEGVFGPAAPAVAPDMKAAQQALIESGIPSLQKQVYAQQLKGMETKPAEPFTLAPGQVRFAHDGKQLATVAPKADKPFIRTRVMGDQEIQEQLQQDGSYQEIGRGPRFARQVSPVVNVGAEGRQGPIIQTDAGPMTVRGGVATPVLGQDGQPLKPKSIEKALPTSAAQKLMENNQNLRKAQQALALISGEKVGDAEGDADATGWKGFIPDATLQRADKKGVDTRAAIGDLGSMVIHDRSGAAVTAAEFPRLRPFIPTVTDAPEAVRKKLSRFVSEYQAVVDEATEFYKGSGYRIPSAALMSGSNKSAVSAGGRAGPQPGTVQDGYRFIGGDPANPSAWEQI